MFSYSDVEGSDTRLLQLSRSASREPLVLVLGHPSYYPRFGFRPASTLGLEAPNPDWPDEAFMAVPLTAYDPAIRGRVAFAPPFG